MIDFIIIVLILGVIHLLFSYFSRIFKEEPFIYKNIRKLNTTEVNGIVFYDHTLSNYLASKHMNTWYEKIKHID